MNEIQKKATTELTFQGELGDYYNISKVFVQSGYFKNVNQISQAMVKVMAGKELGIEPFQAMQNLDIVEGKIFVGANLIAAKIKSSGKYDYRVVTNTDSECEIEFKNTLTNETVGTYKYTIEDAKKMNLANKYNWKAFPRDMCFKRAISGGFRQFCPDILMTPVYDRDTEKDYIEEQAKPRSIIEQIAEEAEIVNSEEPTTNNSQPITDNGQQITDNVQPVYSDEEAMLKQKAMEQLKKQKEALKEGK